MRRAVGTMAVAAWLAVAAPGRAEPADLAPMLAPAMQVITPPAEQAVPLPIVTLLTPDADAASAIIRQGFGRSMMNLYPLAAAGLHLSIGSRVQTRALAGQTEPAPWAAELFAPRGAGLRSMRHMTPAAFLGFDGLIREGVTLGLDAGAAMGRINYALHAPGPFGPGAFGIVGGRSDRGGGGLNPLARLTMGMRF